MELSSTLRTSQEVYERLSDVSTIHKLVKWTRNDQGGTDGRNDNLLEKWSVTVSPPGSSLQTCAIELALLGTIHGDSYDHFSYLFICICVCMCIQTLRVSVYIFI
jgi:hypothetical protein